MPKEIKGNPWRKPPEVGRHADIDEWLPTVMPNLQPIVKALDKSIRREVSGLRYAVKYRRAFYGLPELGWVIELAPYYVSANVLFLGGADFDAPPALGSGRTRYVKVTSLDDATAPDLRAWMKEAGRHTGWT